MANYLILPVAIQPRCVLNTFRRSVRVDGKLKAQVIESDLKKYVRQANQVDFGVSRGNTSVQLVQHGHVIGAILTLGPWR